GEGVLPRPDRVEAERLRQVGHRQLVGVDVRVGARVAEVLEERAGAYVHDGAPFVPSISCSVRWKWATPGSLRPSMRNGTEPAHRLAWIFTHAPKSSVVVTPSIRSMFFRQWARSASLAGAAGAYNVRRV